MKGSKGDKEKYKMSSLRRKEAPGSVMELSPPLKEIKCKPDAEWDSGSGDFRGHPALSFHLVKRN